MSIFSQFNFKPSIQKSLLQHFNFPKLTKTQSIALPLILSSKKDCILQAKTGSGKTLVYILAASNRLRPISEANFYPRTLIFAPSRELGSQIEKVARDLLSNEEPNSYVVSLLSGSQTKTEDIAKLKKLKPSLIVATPGRFQDHCDSNPNFSNLFKYCENLVIDEADTLLSSLNPKGRDMIHKISLSMISRRTFLVSATITEELKRTAKLLFSNDYLYINVDDAQSDAAVNAGIQKSIDQRYLLVPDSFMFTVLYNFLLFELKTPHSNKILVFFPTAKLAEFAYSLFSDHLKLPIQLLHGQMENSKERDQSIKDFRQQTRHSILFTTDLISRGIDFPEIDLVLQFSSPLSVDSYTHRIGRTGRSSSQTQGRSVIILANQEKSFLNHIGEGASMHPLTGFLLKENEKFRSINDLWVNSDSFLIKKADEAVRSLLGHYQQNKLIAVSESKNQKDDISKLSESVVFQNAT
jgi:ATP-dependent RNA helicase MSS116, mitochondrial